MEDKYISNPRPLWDESSTEETRGKRIMTLGSNTAGVVLRVTKEGVEINGYYASLSRRKKHANMREFVFMSWDDFDKMREIVFRREPVGKEITIREPDSLDDEPDQKYLDNLPQVTLNKRKYYVDMVRQERRPVDNPRQVYNFEKQAAKEPS